jgi:hypothetical protein
VTDDPLGDALEESSHFVDDDLVASRASKWEERVVRKIIQSRFDATASVAIVRELRNEVREKTGESRLLFSTFMDKYPFFPVWLVCRPIMYAYDRVDYSNFQAKSEHMFVRVYRESQHLVPGNWEDRPVGIVFEMLHKNSPFNVVHNHKIDMYPFKGARVLLGDPKNLPNFPLWLDRFDLFLSGIGWSTDSE